MPQLFQVVFNGAGVPQGGNLPPDSIRDGKILKSFIKNREDTLSDVMIKAKRDSEIAGRFKGYQTATDIKSQFKQSMVKQNIISSSGGALAAIKSGKIAVTLTKDMPQKLMDQCASEGGVATLVISGKDGKQKVMCIPSAEAMARLKSECFQKGMVPVWVDNETQFSIMRQMECNKKGSMLPISILAATGIALFLTMR
jgi:type I site-specific restriction-modification system R (restriction) subunit